jgi:hypothetical protein
MRLHNILGVAILALALLMPSKATADVIFAIDMDTATAGIQTSRSVSIGEIFDVALVLLLTGGSEVTAFSLGIDFDHSELHVLSVDVSGRPTNFDNVNPVVIDNTAGTVRPFDALSLLSTLSAPSTVLGVLTIQAVAPVTDGFADLTPTYQILGIDGVLDGNFAELSLGVTTGDGGVFFQTGSIDFQTGSIDIVPEPSSALALVALLGGALGVQRFRKTLCSRRTVREGAGLRS